MSRPERLRPPQRSTHHVHAIFATPVARELRWEPVEIDGLDVNSVRNQVAAEWGRPSHSRLPADATSLLKALIALLGGDRGRKDVDA